MSRQSTKNKKKKRDVDSDSSGSDDDVMLHFFVPGERINVEVLGFYLFTYIDKTPKVKTSQHPNDKNRTGFTVTARSGLSVANLRDIMNDTSDWELEMSGKAFKLQPCRYHNSATAKRRLRVGPSKSQDEIAAASQQAQIKSTSPQISSGVPAGAYSQQQQFQQHYQQQQQSADFPRSGPGYYPAASKPEQPPNTYNIHYTAVNTQYTSNAPGVGGFTKDYPMSNYPPTGHPQPINSTSQEPPPYEVANPRSSSYDQQSQRLPPRKPQPGQPDPDSFDRDIKPTRSSNMEMARQGSTAPADDPTDRYISPSRGGEAYSGGSQRQTPYDISRRSGHRS
ncbi:hypothetical protein LTR84_012620 [Exophiala bonariae]|uniref:Velvet domain-containing protein n=1 Tax=Exophiala bonariae TaxID=1690606 RepID=A0AAV9NEU9_9EURO|nr:hypothetical protein LTR84_012620 [Exophiala bonariae]